MNKRGLLLGLAGGLLLLALLALGWLWSASRGAPFWKRAPRLAQDTNPALDVRYRYDPALLKPAKYEQGAEFPLRLDGAGFSFFGKRLAGVGALLTQEPQTMLYDWAASLQAGAFEHWYGMELQGQPVYEDAKLHGRLGSHETLVYRLGGEGSMWPSYFPESVTGSTPPEAEQDGAGATGQTGAESAPGTGGPAATAYIEGWVLFSDRDLFYFYAVSATPLSAEQRGACLTLINSLEFGALLGSPQPPDAGVGSPPAEPRGTPEGQAGQEPPPSEDGTTPPAETQPPAEPAPGEPAPGEPLPPPPAAGN